MNTLSSTPCTAAELMNTPIAAELFPVGEILADEIDARRLDQSRLCRGARTSGTVCLGDYFREEGDHTRIRSPDRCRPGHLCGVLA